MEFNITGGSEIDEKEERNPPEARIERFIWREGDLQIIYDPHKDRTRKEGSNLDDENQVELQERDRRGDA